MNPSPPQTSFLDRPLTVFTSPKSGSGQGRQEIDRLLALLSQSGADVTVTSEIAVLDRMRESGAANPTLPAGTPAEPKAVIAAGGDGTISLVATRLGFIEGSQHRSSHLAPPFVILPMPMGTENLLARYFGHRPDADTVMKTLQEGTLKWIDCGRVNNEPFLTMATFGFDAEVVRAMHLRRKGHIRKIHYLSPILRAMRTYAFPPIHLSMNAEDVDDCYQQLGNDLTQHNQIEVSLTWAMCFNLPCYGGGLEIEPNAIGDDGLLDIIGFKGGSIASGLRYVYGIKRGTHLEDSDIVRFRARRVEVTSDKRVPWQRDGDYGGRTPANSEPRPTVLSLQPAALPLLVPSGM